MAMLPHPPAIACALMQARRLFEAVGTRTFDGVGYTRAAFGEGEQIAHDMIAEAARGLELSVETDAALNLHVTLPGSSRELPALFIGSHLDAVPHGGNFDGLAGVLAGLASLDAMVRAGLRPKRDVVLLAIRAEESAWFGAQHIGSRAILGMLPPRMLDEARRADTGRSLGDHMATAGADVTRIRQGKPLRDPSTIGGFLELHIEQGPLLSANGLPIGIVTGIRGNRRCRRIVCRGEYGHSGTVPRSLRRDAVLAVSELVTRMEDLWHRVEAEGGDLVLTFGRYATNPASHAVTVIPGEVEFSFDARSHSPHTLGAVEAAVKQAMGEIGRRRGVTFSFDRFTGDMPVGMDKGFQELLWRGCDEMSVAAMAIASGAGHDAGDFAAAGVPTAMIFVRNENGSHNPAEAMEFEDFEKAVRVMIRFVIDWMETR